MKQIMYLIIGVMLLSIVSIVKADTNISIDVTTLEDINIWAHPNTLGLTTYHLYGYNGNADSGNNEGMTMKNVYWRISEIFMKQRNTDKKWFTVNPLKLDKYEQRFWWVMNQYFVPREEFNQLVEYTNRLDARMTMYEDIIGLDKVLAKNKEFALENNMKEFIFRGKTYTRVGNEYVHIQLKSIK